MQVPLRMSVEHISFSAHADFDQTSQFVELLNPPHVILVHGEAVEMGRLRKALEQQAVNLGQRRLLYTPKVCQPVHIKHRPQLKAKVRTCQPCQNRSGCHFLRSGQEMRLSVMHAALEIIPQDARSTPEAGVLAALHQWD